MNAIVAVDSRWAIGREGGMLFHLPEDLKYFLRMTRGKTLVMGRATLASLPGGRPLKDRRCIVLSRNEGLRIEGAEVLHSKEELARAVLGIPKNEVMLIGGESLYRDLLPRCEKAYVTKIRAAAPDDRHFPNLDALPAWRLTEQGEEREENGLRFAFCVYENSSVEPLG